MRNLLLLTFVKNEILSRSDELFPSRGSEVELLDLQNVRRHNKISGDLGRATELIGSVILCNTVHQFKKSDQTLCLSR